MAVNTLKRHFYPCMPTDDKNIAINLYLLQYKMAAQKKNIFKNNRTRQEPSPISSKIFVNFLIRKQI